MTFAPWLGFFAALACAVFMGAWHLASPRVETRDVVREVPVLPANLNRATVLKAFANQHAAQETVIPNPSGYPMLCRTTSPEGDFDVFLQWCVRATRQEAALGG
jgi:hypothetical protein